MGTLSWTLVAGCSLLEEMTWYCKSLAADCMLYIHVHTVMYARCRPVWRQHRVKRSSKKIMQFKTAAAVTWRAGYLGGNDLFPYRYLWLTCEKYLSSQVRRGHTGFGNPGHSMAVDCKVPGLFVCCPSYYYRGRVVLVLTVSLKHAVVRPRWRSHVPQEKRGHPGKDQHWATAPD